MPLIFPAMPRPLDLTDKESAELVRVVRGVIDDDRYPLSARVRRLKAVLDKLDPSRVSTSESFPAPKPAGRTELCAEAEAAVSSRA